MDVSILSVLGNISVKCLLVADRCSTGAGHDHCFRLAIQTVCHVLTEVLDDELHLLRNVGWVQRHPLSQGTFCSLAAHPLVVLYLLSKVERGFVRHIALQHIQDESFFDGLAHFVLVEGFGQIVLGWLPRWIWNAAKQHQCGVFGRTSKGEVADVIRTCPRLLKLLQ